MTVAAFPEILIPHVPLAPVPVVLGAPIVLYETVNAPEPLKVDPLAPPAPPLLKVTLFVTDPAVVALAADPPIDKPLAVPVKPVPGPLNCVDAVIVVPQRL